jgi:hypothetical protein
VELRNREQKRSGPGENEADSSGKVALPSHKTMAYDGKKRLCQKPSGMTSGGTLIVARLVAQF